MATVEPPLGEILQAPTSDQLVFPVGTEVVTAELIQGSDRTVDVLTLECMAQVGFDLGTGPALSSPWPVDFDGRRYDVLSQAEADAIGYHGGRPEEDELVSGQARSDFFASLSPEQDRAWRRCYSSAEEEVGSRRLLNLFNSLNDIANEAYAAAETDSRVLAAIEGWRQCMDGMGYSYSSPFDASEDPRWSSEMPSREERDVAVADVRCKQTSNFAGVFHAVESAYQAVLLSEHPGLIDRLRAQVELVESHLS